MVDPECHSLVLLHPGLTGVLPAAVIFLLDRPDDHHLLLN
jgi:hypothetical protein